MKKISVCIQTRVRGGGERGLGFNESGSLLKFMHFLCFFVNLFANCSSSALAFSFSLSLPRFAHSSLSTSLSAQKSLSFPKSSKNAKVSFTRVSLSGDYVMHLKSSATQQLLPGIMKSKNSCWIFKADFTWSTLTFVSMFFDVLELKPR